MKTSLFWLLLPSLALAAKGPKPPHPAKPLQVAPLPDHQPVKHYDALNAPSSPEHLLRMVHHLDGRTHIHIPCSSNDPTLCSQEFCKIHTAADPKYNCETIFKHYPQLQNKSPSSSSARPRNVVAKVRLRRCEPWDKRPVTSCTNQICDVIDARWTENACRHRAEKQPKWKRSLVDSPSKFSDPPEVESFDRAENDPAPERRPGSWLAKINDRIEKQYDIVSRRRKVVVETSSSKSLKKLKAQETKLSNLERLRDKKLKMEKKKADMKVKWAGRKNAVKKKWAGKKADITSKWSDRKADIKEKWARRKEQKRREREQREDSKRKKGKLGKKPSFDSEDDFEDDFDEEALDIDQQLEEVDASEGEVAEEEAFEEEIDEEEAVEKLKRSGGGKRRKGGKRKSKPAVEEEEEEEEEEVVEKPKKKKKPKKEEPWHTEELHEWAERSEEKDTVKANTEALREWDDEASTKPSEKKKDTVEKSNSGGSADDVDEKEEVIVKYSKEGRKMISKTTNKKDSKVKRDVSQESSLPTATITSTPIEPITGNTKLAKATRAPVPRKEVVDNLIKPENAKPTTIKVRVPGPVLAKPAKPTATPVQKPTPIDWLVKPETTKPAKPTGTYFPAYQSIDRHVAKPKTVKPAKPTGTPIPKPKSRRPKSAKPKSGKTAQPTVTPVYGVEGVGSLPKSETVKSAKPTTTSAQSSQPTTLPKAAKSTNNTKEGGQGTNRLTARSRVGCRRGG